MKSHPKPGLTGEERLTVDESNRIRFADDRMPPVLATPWLIQHLEFAARRALEPILDAHERTVGTYVEVEHLAPAPLGANVVCKARVIHVEGQVVTFQVEAHDEIEPLARGIHRRRIIDVDRFSKRIAKKIGRISK